MIRISKTDVLDELKYASPREQVSLLFKEVSQGLLSV